MQRGNVDSLITCPFLLVNPISGAHNQRGVPAVRTSSPFSRTSVESPDDLSEEASRMNEVVISLMYSSLLICVSQEVSTYFILNTSDVCGRIQLVRNLGG